MRSHIRSGALFLCLALVAGLMALPAYAGHNDEDDHSENFKQKARLPIKIAKDLNAQGSDLAFSGRKLIAGSYQGVGLFKMIKRKPYLKQKGFFNCPGGQGDVTVFKGRYVFVSIDSPSTNNGTGKHCNNTKTNRSDSSEGKEGLRIVDIKDPKNMKQVGFVEMDCGSHTNTLLPGATKSYIYIESYPLGGQGPSCNALTHRKVQIVEFPNNNPAAAKLLDQTIDVSPQIGCHDITTFPDRDLMVGACINQSFIWDISDPTNPKQLATIENPNMQIHHSTATTWDGKILILGDEYAGAAGGGGCTGNEDSNVGAAWFYDISDPSNPTLMGHHSLPRIPENADSPDEAERYRCTNHNFNVIPMKNEKKYLLAVSYYQGGIAVVDFSDPSDPTEVGHYVTTPGGVAQDTWAAYWYNGRIYTNDYLSQLGVGVYFFKGTGPKNTYFFRGDMNPQVQFEANLRK